MFGKLNKDLEIRDIVCGACSTTVAGLSARQTALELQILIVRQDLNLRSHNLILHIVRRPNLQAEMRLLGILGVPRLSAAIHFLGRSATMQWVSS